MKQADKKLTLPDTGLDETPKLGNSFVSTARGLLTDATDGISKEYGVVTNRLKVMSSQVERKLKRTPLLALSAAVGIGWTLGRFLVPKASALLRKTPRESTSL